MSRAPTIQRLPNPPQLRGGLPNYESDMKMMHEHVTTMTTILNQAVQNLQNRVNTIQQVGANAPPPVTGLAVEGKQGLFSLTWNRIHNADGYVIVHASDTAMKQIVGRYNIPDGNQPLHQIPVGNAAVSGSFQVYAYQGNQYSDPSPAVSATTAILSTSTEAAPKTPPIRPLQPKVSGVRNGTTL
jgi:hypothetical protein